MRVRRQTPAGHGELLTEPSYDRWAGIAHDNAAAAAGWTFEVAGVPVGKLRAQAREESLRAAVEFSSAIGVEVAGPRGADELIVMTGHQPELFHPGIWVKDFLMQRLADEIGSTALDVVVDSDGFGRIELRTPCLRSGVNRCAVSLAESEPDGCYACTPAPSREELLEFRRGGAEALSTLPAPALIRHFNSFCDALEQASVRAGDIGSAITIARRLYEAPADTTYLELPLTHQVRSGVFLRFVTHLVHHAGRFASEYNAELRAFRERTGTRSAAQPFPDLTTGDTVELPLWMLAEGKRHTIAVRPGERPALVSDGTVLLELGDSPQDSFELLADSGIHIAPKALALTLFERMFVSDIFIHGVGGGRYDQVTDGVIERFFGVEPPRFVVASMTLHLPLGGHVVTDADLALAEQRLNKLRHNPDQLLGEIDFENADEKRLATSLSAEKCELVLAIAAPEADKKSIGARIREVNTLLAELMEPLVIATERELEELKVLKGAGEVLSDRTYPFCLWDPREVADKVR